MRVDEAVLDEHVWAAGVVHVSADVADLLGVHDVDVLVLAEELPRRGVLLLLRLLSLLSVAVAAALLFVHVRRVVAADLPGLTLGVVVAVVRVAALAVLVLFLLVPASCLTVAARREDGLSHFTRVLTLTLTENKTCD